MGEGRFESSLFVSRFLCLDGLGLLEVDDVTEERDTAWPGMSHGRKHKCGCRERKSEKKEEQQHIRENCPGVAYCQALHAWMNLKFTWK